MSNEVSISLLRTMRDKFPISGGYTTLFVELYGGLLVEMHSYEPDANTFRENYYYNTTNNVLYRLIEVADGKVWKAVSQ